ncbi:MAG TPA: type VI secretion system tube protein Hcp, partial [Steroidobacteraceae bacterium]|nr:type VI secretion system tube protein Hcp [Steroidobacteraceae bacterium]
TGWIMVDSLQFGVARNLNNPLGHATSREAGQPNVSEIHCTKSMDNASIELFGWSVAEFLTKKLQIDVTSTGRTDKPFASYTLTNCVISGYSVSCAGTNAQPTESLSFNFTQLEMKYVTYGADNVTPTSTVVKGYDLALGQPTS